MANFKAFKPEAMERIARSMGHQGDMNQFQNFLAQNPEKTKQMQMYNMKAMEMARGGVVKLQTGGEAPKEPEPQDTKEPSNLMDINIGNVTDPQLPTDTKLEPELIDQDTAGTKIDKDVGQVDEDKAGVTATTGTVQTADDATKVEAETYDATKAGDAPEAEAKKTVVTEEMLVKAAQGTMSPEEQKAYAAAVESGQAIVNPNATVQGRLEEMGKQAQDGSIPAYATAAVRSAMGAMAARGLGSSSMATGAVVNSILEASIPIAKQDAATYAEYGLKNASNKMMATLAKAGALSSLNMANLNNRQQAVVENAKTFLSVDLANLANEQQAELTNTQIVSQFMLSDQAADNASKQFNASSRNQTNQFMANLANNISQFNASQLNAMEQFNAGEINSTAKFNAEMKNLNEQFNAKNQLIIEQFNAQWRQSVATTNTAAINQANQINATALLDISKTAMANMWSHMSDVMEWAWTSGENEQDRITELTIAEISAKIEKYKADLNLSAAQSAGLGSLFGEILTNPLAGTFLGSIFPSLGTTSASQLKASEPDPT